MPVIYFAYDSDVLVPSETANLDKIAAYLNNHPSLGLVIEGHCDSRGTDEYNRALGERRANAIRAYLAGRGVADAKMKTVSYGKDKPAVDGSGEGIWRQNRRGVPVPMQIPAR
jgi:peptidoglycan-associated lipoprotein